MNILFLTHGDLQPYTNGVLRVTYNLAQRFSLDGHNVYFMSTLKSESASYPENVKVAHFPSSDPTNLENYTFLQKYVDDQQIDIIINQIGTDRPFCQLFTSPQRCKIISVVHNDPWDLLLCYYYFYFRSWRGKLLAPLAPIMKYRNKMRLKRHYQQLVLESDAVVLLSDFYKRRFKCLKSEKVVSIPNAAPDAISKVANRKKQVIFVGRLYSAQKAPEYLIKAWTRIYHKFPDWELLLLGDGPDRHSIEKLITKIGGKNAHIKLMGFVDSAPYFQSASIIGMTSRFEGWPMVLLEAMSQGCVPISFETSKAMRDIIDDGVNGRVVKIFDTAMFANALSELMTNPITLSEYSQNAIRKSQQFSIDKIADMWYTLFQKLLSSQQS
jgi:glycosyltransferase involved in cell wall biosynthesis